MDAEPIELWRSVFGVSEEELASFGLAWARVLPAILIVPAFGFRAVPLPVRAAFAFVLAAGIAPGLAPVSSPGEATFLQFAIEALAGLPLALSASAALWAATMTGALVDDLRGAARPAMGGVVGSGATPLGTLLGLFAALAFLRLGGTTEILADMSSVDAGSSLTRAVRDVAKGIALAVGLAAPLIAVTIVTDVVRALTARAAPAGALTLSANTLRPLMIIAALGLVLDRIAELVAENVVLGP